MQVGMPTSVSNLSVLTVLGLASQNHPCDLRWVEKPRTLTSLIYKSSAEPDDLQEHKKPSDN